MRRVLSKRPKKEKKKLMRRQTAKDGGSSRMSGTTASGLSGRSSMIASYGRPRSFTSVTPSRHSDEFKTTAGGGGGGGGGGVEGGDGATTVRGEEGQEKGTVHPTKIKLHFWSPTLHMNGTSLDVIAANEPPSSQPGCLETLEGRWIDAQLPTLTPSIGDLSYGMKFVSNFFFSSFPVFFFFLFLIVFFFDLILRYELCRIFLIFFSCSLFFF